MMNYDNGFNDWSLFSRAQPLVVWVLMITLIEFTPFFPFKHDFHGATSVRLAIRSITTIKREREVNYQGYLTFGVAKHVPLSDLALLLHIHDGAIGK